MLYYHLLTICTAAVSIGTALGVAMTMADDAEKYFNEAIGRKTEMQISEEVCKQGVWGLQGLSALGGSGDCRASVPWEGLGLGTAGPQCPGRAGSGDCRASVP